ncbi:hypothetical protein EDB89DRAFT_2244490 [Lactarius sanguifluus]|nr:hypothetical protein EDB89DRAFT_2244490 [Lactarius sanguifluus]
MNATERHVETLQEVEGGKSDGGRRGNEGDGKTLQEVKATERDTARVTQGEGDGSTFETLQEVETGESDGGMKATEARLKALREVEGGKSDGGAKASAVEDEKREDEIRNKQERMGGSIPK